MYTIPISTSTKMNTTNMLTFSNSKLSANNTKSEKYPKKYCSVMLCFCFTTICTVGVCLWQMAVFAPKIPSTSKHTSSTSEKLFKKLKCKLQKIISITIFIITKKYNGTKALTKSKNFFILIFCAIFLLLLLSIFAKIEQKLK